MSKKPIRKVVRKALKPVEKPLSPTQRAFLAAYAIRGSITEAAKSAEIDRVLHYRWLMVDELYQREFVVRKELVAEMLEDEAIRRAYEGIDEPVTWQGGFSYPEVLDPETKELRKDFSASPLSVKKYSDTLLQFMLKALRPEKYRDRVSAELTGKGGGPIAVTEDKLKNLSDAELVQLAALSKRLSEFEGD